MITKFNPLNAKKDTGRTIGDNEVAKLANLNRMVDQVNTALAGGGGLGTLDIVTEGIIGYNPNFQYSTYAYPSGTVSGSQSVEVSAIPSIDLSAQGDGFGANSLTSIAFTTLKYANYIDIFGYSELTTISAPKLLQTNALQFSALFSLHTLDFPSLTKCTGIQIRGDSPFSITTLNFPALQSAAFNVSNGYCGIPSISNAKFSALTSISLEGNNVSDFVSVDLPLATEISYSGFSYNGSTFTTLNVPNIVVVKTSYIDFSSCNNLTNVTFGTVGTFKRFVVNGNSPYISFQYCNLNQASVDNILKVLASLDGTNGTTISLYGSLYLNGGSNASPSSAGYNARNILQSRGWYIATN